MKKMILLILAGILSLPVFAEPVWVDVRTQQEHAQDNIAGDILIPHDSDIAEFNKALPDKNAELNLYCRSGRRAGIAVNKLKEAGYTNVTNAGGIEDARKARFINKQ